MLRTMRLRKAPARRRPSQAGPDPRIRPRPPCGEPAAPPFRASSRASSVLAAAWLRMVSELAIPLPRFLPAASRFMRHPRDPTGNASYHPVRSPGGTTPSVRSRLSRSHPYWLPGGSAGSSGETCGGLPFTMSPTRNPAPREEGMAWASSPQFMVSRIRWRANAVSHSVVTRVR